MTLNPRKGYRERQVHKAQTHGLESKPERVREPVQVAVRETDMNYKEKVHWLSKNKPGIGGTGSENRCKSSLTSPPQESKAHNVSVCVLSHSFVLTLAPSLHSLPTKHMMVQRSEVQGPQKNSIGLNVNATQPLKASAPDRPGA